MEKRGPSVDEDIDNVRASQSDKVQQKLKKDMLIKQIMTVYSMPRNE